MQVEASVDEADIGQIRAGQMVSFTVDSYPDDVFKAKVRQVRQAPVEAQNVVSYLVIIDVDNVNGKLLPGMTANVEIITDVRTNVTRVPSNAMRFRPRLADRPTSAAEKAAASTGKKAIVPPKVYLVGDDAYRPVRRVIRTGLQGEEYTEVISGIKAGDKVLVRTKSLKPKKESDESADEDDNAAN
jgi:HlyD family secretion protein